MALDLQHFLRLRPHLYHLTGRENVFSIQKDMLLKSANAIFDEAGESRLRRTVRRGHRTVMIGERNVHIRDQDPLHAGNISFYDGWSIEDLVEHLNNHVFFWPGWEHGPVTSGRNHFARYSGERPVVLRTLSHELLMANSNMQPFFCRYNSGAPRCTYGAGSPRGKQTFLPAADFHLSPSQVVEVTFKTQVRLPVSILAANSLNGPWAPLKDFKP